MTDATQAGVSVTFLCSAEKCLRRQYGARLCGEGFNDFIHALGTAEQIWRTLPPDPAKRGKRP